MAIGRAIVREPKVFLFDEPLSNLDAKLRVQMRVELTRLHRQLRRHDDLCHPRPGRGDDHGRQDRGAEPGPRSSRSGGRSISIISPRNRFVAGFIGSPAMNFLARIDCGGRQRTDQRDDRRRQDGCRAAQAGKAAVGAPVTLGIRPEALDPAGKGDAILTGKVFAVERLGNETYVYLEVPGSKEFAVHAAGDVVVKPGDEMSSGLRPRIAICSMRRVEPSPVNHLSESPCRCYQLP